MKAVGSITVIFRCGELLYIYISASQKWSCRLSSFTECDPVALCHIRVIFTENNPTTARPFKVFFPAWVGSGDGVKYDTSELSSLTVFLQPRFKTCFLVDRARWAHLRRIAGITFSALHLLCCICFESWQLISQKERKNEKQSWPKVQISSSSLWLCRSWTGWIMLWRDVEICLSGVSRVPAVPRGWWHHHRYHGYRLFVGVQQQLWWQISFLIKFFVLIVLLPFGCASSVH